MHMKRMLSALLAAFLVLGLAACGASGGETAAEQEQTPYAGLIESIAQSYNDPDATALSAQTAAYGEALAQARIDAADSASFGDDKTKELARRNVLHLTDWAAGQEVQIDVTDAAQFTEEELTLVKTEAEASAQSFQSLKDLSAALSEQPDAGETEADAQSETDAAEAPSEENVAQLQTYVDRMVALGDLVAAQEITDGYTLKLTVTIDGAATELETSVLLVDGAWVLGDFYQTMSR